MKGIPHKYAYLILGLVLAAGAPLGWLILSQLAPSPVSEKGLYLYLSVGTAVAFGGFGYVLGYIQDQVKRNAKLDPLTRVWNQQAFLDFTQVLVNMCERDDAPLSLIALDIDEFKGVNDRHGHLFGSYVLRTVAEIIGNYARRSDVVGRYGGDEFMICLPHTRAADAAALAERIRRAVAEIEFLQGGHAARISVSAGITETYGQTYRTPPTLVEGADRALYEAKNAGRNRIALWTADEVSLLLPQTFDPDRAKPQRARAH